MPQERSRGEPARFLPSRPQPAPRQKGKSQHQWEQGDCIALPLKNFGVEYQFFNFDGQNPARYLTVTPNFFEVLGVDLGSSFEQLEDAWP